MVQCSACDLKGCLFGPCSQHLLGERSSTMTKGYMCVRDVKTDIVCWAADQEV